MNQFNKPPLGSQIDFSHPLARGMVLCLLMNEGSGNRIHDISGNNNHGVLTNGPLWKPGRDGWALAFDGSNDYVGCGNDASLMPKNFTISFWMSTAEITFGNWKGIMGKGGYSSGWRILDYYNRAYLQLTFGTDTAPTYAYQFPSLGINIWHFISFTYDHNYIKFYYDGEQIGSIAETRDLKENTSPLIIGQAQYFFNGLISSVSIYNRALSPQEVAELYINPYAFIHQPRKYWLMPQGVTIPPHLFTRRAA